MDEHRLVSQSLLYIDEKMALFSACPEAKLLWMKLLLFTRFTDYQTTLTSRELCEGMRVSSRTFTQSVNKLIDADLFPSGTLLTRESIKTGKGGNSYKYSVTPPKSLTSCDSKTEGLFSKLYKDILDYEGLGNKAGKLTLANKLVLLLLLHFSDEFGHVYSLGLAKLAALSGMRKERVKSHIEKLCNIGLIHYSVPGGTIPCLMGKVSSQYFLNLEHSIFRGEVSGYWFSHLNYHMPNESLVDHVASHISKRRADPITTEPMIQACYEGALIFKLDVRVATKPLRRYFNVKYDDLLRTHLKTKVNDMASYMLNHYWPKIDTRSLISSELHFEILTDDNLISLVEKNLLPEPVIRFLSKDKSFRQRASINRLANESLELRNGKMDRIPGGQELCTLFIYMAWVKAIEAKMWITSQLENRSVTPLDCEFKIRPYSRDQNGIDVVCLLKNEVIK